MIKTGDIILLTRRKFDWKIWRWVLSWLIYIFNGKFVHTALPFMDNGTMYIREMEYNGVRTNQTLDSYIKQYKDRIHVMKPVIKISANDASWLSNICKLNPADYEYKALIWQLIKSITGFYIGGKTPQKRPCSEDTARCYNLMKPTFEHEESISPMEISLHKDFFIYKLTN